MDTLVPPPGEGRVYGSQRRVRLSEMDAAGRLRLDTVARYLQDGSVGPKKSYFHRQDSDPSPVEVDFHFPRLGKVTPEDYASDHCPVFLEVP